MKFLIYHCFYNYFSNQSFVVHINDLMKMLIFCWFYIYYWIVQHSNSMSFLLFSSALRSRLGAPKSSQDARRVPNAPSSRCYRLSLDHIKHTLNLGSRDGISDTKQNLLGVLRWDHIYLYLSVNKWSFLHSCRVQLSSHSATWLDLRLGRLACVYAHICICIGMCIRIHIYMWVYVST